MKFDQNYYLVQSNSIITNQYLFVKIDFRYLVIYLLGTKNLYILFVNDFITIKAA